MPVDFSVKRVPDAVATLLRERAGRNHRSLQRELLSILEAAVMADVGPARVAEPGPTPYATPTGRRPSSRGGKRRERLTLDELWERARRIGGPIPGDSATSIIRKDRDERSRH